MGQSFPLTNIFQRGRSSTNQVYIYVFIIVIINDDGCGYDGRMHDGKPSDSP